MLNKWFKKIIMAFTLNGEPVIKEKKQNEELQTPITETQNQLYQLNSNELALLIKMISQSTFEGNQIEIIYNTVIKLQNQFLEQNK